MATILNRAWWMLLLRGGAALLFGLLLLFAPGLTLATGALSFALLFAVYTLVNGISTVVAAVMRREGQWLLLLLLGIVGIVASLLVLGNPLLFSILTIQVMIFIVAFNAIASGIVEIVAAWQLRQEIEGEWLLMLNGLFALLFGLILIARPITAVEVLILIAAFYALAAGAIQIILAFRVRGWSNTLEHLKKVASS